MQEVCETWFISFVPLLYNLHCNKISKCLFERGFFVNAIRPPTVPPKTARLRFTLSANHTKDQIETLLEKVNDAMA